MSFTNTPASNSSRPADDQAPEQDLSEIMLPPQISTFCGTVLQLFQYLQDLAARHHNALVIACSEKQSKSNDYHTMTFRCDKGPKVKDSVTKSMQSTSRKVECPFEIRAGYSKIHLCWTIRYTCSKHSNHPPSDDPSSHSVLRRFNPLEKDRVSHLQEAYVQPREVQQFLEMKDLIQWPAWIQYIMQTFPTSSSFWVTKSPLKLQLISARMKASPTKLKQIFWKPHWIYL